MGNYRGKVIDPDLKEIVKDLDLVEHYWRNARNKKVKQAYYKLWYVILVSKHKHMQGDYS